MTIAHAFNYRMAVLRDGVTSAVRVARARKEEGCFLVNSDIPWGQQVAVIFSDCVHYGVGIAVVSRRIRRIEGHVAKCTITI